MTDQQEHVPPAPPRRPVSFGPGAVPHEWAERMLTQLAEEKPQIFKTLLGQAALNGRG